MLYDLLTELDKTKIESYRDCYTYPETAKDAAPLEHILRPWDEAKSEYLKKLFGDQLIITRPVEFKEGIEEIEQNLQEIFSGDRRISNFEDAICDIYDKIAQPYDYWDAPSIEQRFVRNLFSYHTLAINKISNQRFFNDEKTFELHIKDKIIKVQQDAKPIKLITKIANAYGIGITPDEKGVSDLEYYRRRHSLGLNQKLLKGELCLSIHPLDYMTMSDNNEGWDSCMSWENDGEYRQGTVEMMNSPCVVVGYLSAGPEEFSWGAKPEQHWNSKKWRSLFVVDKEFIINVRSYPYENENLVKEAIKELAKLSGWGEVNPERYTYYDNYEHTPVAVGGRKVALSFCTGKMYNDFGRGHHIAVNPQNTEDICNSYYYYSGVSECMWCGVTNDIETTDTLLCNNCAPSFYCEYCDERYTGESGYTTADGMVVCEYCWENNCSEDRITGETYISEDLYKIYLATEDRLTELRRYCGSILVHPDTFGSALWHQYFNATKPYTCYTSFGLLYRYVLISECTTKGLELFGLFDEENVKNYVDSIKPH